MRRFFYLVVCLVFVQGQSQSLMNDSEASDLISKVKSLAQSTQTISSDFVQYKHLDFLDNDIETSGKLAFKAPDLVKWEYVNPFEYSVLFKDNQLFINDEGKKSNIDIGSNKLFKQLNNLIISSVKGDMFDDSKFDMEFFKEGTGSFVRFNPKDKKFSKYIKTFQITFNDLGDVTEVKMIEPSEDYTRIVFINKQINEDIDETVFTD